MYGIILPAWGIIGAFFTIIGGALVYCWADDKHRFYGNRWSNSTFEARVALSVLSAPLIGALWPLIVVGVLGLGLASLGRTVVLGVRDLYRMFFPPKADLPEARVHR